MSTSGANAGKSSNRASWDWFCRLLEPRPESHQIEPPGTGFIDFWSQDQKVTKSSLLGLVLSTPAAKARKSSNRASWDYFCRLLGPRPESHQIEPPGTSFVDFWSQGQKVIKSSLLGLLLSTSEAKARKSSNRASWDWFSRLLEPRPESHQIELPGTGFVDFWSQGQEVIKSSFLELIFSTSGAKARKSLNRASWNWFCRLLEPRPGSHLQVPIPALNDPQEHQNASKVKPGGVKVHHCRSQECPEASKCTPRITQMHPKRFQ